MQKIVLSQKRKTGLMIGLVNTFVVLIISFLYVVIFYYSTLADLRTGLLTEAEEIASTHILIDGDSIIYNTIDGVNSIESDLYTDGLSAIIFNKELEEIGRFGLFDFNETLLTDDVNINDMAKSSLDISKYQYYSEIDLHEKDTFELISYPIVNKGQTYGVVLIFASTADLQKTLSLSINVTLSIIVFSMIINLILGQILSKYINRPVKEIIKQMNMVRVDRTNKKVTPMGSPADEQYQLALKYNEMLDRLNEGVQKQKQFISNASHELKSPLARVVSQLDVIKLRLSKERKGQEYQEIFKKLEFAKGELTDVGDLVHNLLSLSKISEQNVKYDEVIVHTFVQELIDKYKPAKIEVKLEAAIINFSPEYLRSILNNLLENALKYGDNDTLILKGEVKNRIYEFIIENHVSNKPTKNSSNRSESYGFGLSLIKEIIKQEGLELSITNSNGIFAVVVSGFKVVVKPE